TVVGGWIRPSPLASPTPRWRTIPTSCTDLARWAPRAYASAMDVAAPTEATGISLEELQLAARNHGMPLEALRYDVTPLGLHYLLTHYDVPPVDASSWRLDLGGRVRRPMSLSLDDIGARPAVTAAITFECAGNGRAQLSPRPISQPWLAEAVGTGEWTGTPLAGVLEEAGVQPDAVDVVFAGLDHGMEGEVEQDF